MGNRVIVQEGIQQKIYFIRGQKVMLDKDLAILYGVATKRLNEQVKRNIKRFPADFMFQLTLEEAEISRSQNATMKQGTNIKYLPYAFTEQGIAMLSSVLNSERAIQVNIIIMRAFVKTREILLTHKELAQKLNDLERKYGQHDAQIIEILKAIRSLMIMSEKPQRKIGFQP